jgi:Eukaryotic porin
LLIIRQILTTNVAYNPAKEAKLNTKLSVKCSHPSGFTLEKFEVANDGNVSTETSLVGFAPNLKFEFKGNDSDKGDFSVTYKHAAATVTAEVDTISFSKAKASVVVGHGAFTAGANADLEIAKMAISSSAFTLGAGYTVPKSIFAGVRVSKGFNEYSGNFHYVAAPNVTLAGTAAYSLKTKNASCVLATIYKCNDTTLLKLKASSNGVVNASVKQQFPKKFVAVGSMEIPSSLNGIKFGVNATLG